MSHWECVVDFFNGSVIMHLFRKNIAVESGIRDGFLEFVRSLVHFLLGLGLGLGSL